MRQSLEIAQLLSIKSLYSPRLHHQSPPPSAPGASQGPAPPVLTCCSQRMKWPAPHLRHSRKPATLKQISSCLWVKISGSLLQFHQWCHLKKKQYFPRPPTPSFLMLRVGKMACCRIFETNMGLRPRHLMSGVPQTTLRINNSLEELRELKQATILIVVVYYSERIHITISKGLRLCAPNARDPSLISGQGTRSHMPQLKIPRAATKTQCSQINK